MTSKKRKCVVKNGMFLGFPSFKKGKSDHDVFCNLCNTYISIANKGKLDISDHIKTLKHQKNVQSSSGMSNCLQKFVLSDTDNTLRSIRAAEGALA